MPSDERTLGRLLEAVAAALARWGETAALRRNDVGNILVVVDGEVVGYINVLAGDVSDFGDWTWPE